MHESLNEFKFYPDPTISSGVICPCASATSMYIVVTTLALLFLIGSDTGKEDNHKSLDESNFDQIRPRTAELAALERLKKFPWTYNGRNVLTNLAPSFLNQNLATENHNKTTALERSVMNYWGWLKLALRAQPHPQFLKWNIDVRFAS